MQRLTRADSPSEKAKKGIWLRELSGNAQFAFLLVLRCTVVSNLAARLAKALIWQLNYN